MSLTFAASDAQVWVAAALVAMTWLAAALLQGRGAGGGRPRGRLALLALACAALFLLAVEPQRTASVRGGEAVLLTSGATAGDLAAAAADGLPAWAVPAGPGEPPPPAGAPQVPDAAALLRLHPEAARLRLAGHGLSPWELRELTAPLTAAAPPPLPFGIARISWPRRLALGETWQVSGVAAAVPAGGATLRLSGPAVGEAATRLPAGNAPFTLRLVPRGAGRHLVELRLETAGQATRVEHLDVEVVPAAPPSLLWLEAAPSAEARELKRWLAAAGGSMAWRAQLSRGVARDEVVGPALLAPGPLSPATLRRFDLVVADSRTLAGLGAGERAALAAAVREEGLGLLLRAGNGPPAALGVEFPLRPIAGGGELSARLDWARLGLVAIDPGPRSSDATTVAARAGGGESAPLALEAREIAPLGSLAPLAVDRGGRVLAAWRPLGAGAVGVTLVDGTWRWVLSGHAEDHRRHWRHTIAALARPTPSTPRWEAGAGPRFVGLPVVLTLAGEPAPPPLAVRDARGETLDLPLRQGEHEATRWTTTLWPRRAGWHRLGEGNAASWLWVAPAESWTTWRLAVRQEATAARQLMAGPGHTPAPLTDVPRQRVPVPRWPLFLVLLAAWVALWAMEQFGAAPRTEPGPGGAPG